MEDCDIDEDLVVINFQYYQKLAEREGCDDNSILIYSGSIFSCIKNYNILVDIRKSDHKMRSVTNGGYKYSTLEADMLKFFTVWHHPNSLMSILSYKDVWKRFRITSDTVVEDAIHVHRGIVR